MFTKRLLIVLAASALLLALGISSRFINTAQAFPPAQINATIPYPGRLSDDAGRPVADGAYDFAFALYDTETGGTLLWSETQRGVPVKAGDFVVSLGSASPIPAKALNSIKLWLAVSVRGPGESDLTALTPRQVLSPASSLAPASPSAGPACAHDHLGEVWNANIGWSNAGLRINNSANGPALWGYNTGGGNGVRGESNTGMGVYGWSESSPGVTGRSTYHRGVEGYGSSQWAGVYGDGGTGVKGESTVTDGIGVWGVANTGSNAIGVYGVSSSGWAGKFDGHVTVQNQLIVVGLATFNGGKSGYVVEIAQNDDTVPLAAGDVVVISGAGPAVVGQIPLVKVRRAVAGETSAVVGVVDQHYIPASAEVAANPNADVKAESAVDNAAVAPGEYLTIVTLGAYKAIKVDASYGVIAPGDLLVASPNPGYAMRATLPKPGTILGKALGALPSGTGVIAVIITLQ